MMPDLISPTRPPRRDTAGRVGIASAGLPARGEDWERDARSARPMFQPAQPNSPVGERRSSDGGDALGRSRYEPAESVPEPWPALACAAVWLLLAMAGWALVIWLLAW